MKGIILNLLQTVTEEAHGEAAWDDLLQETGIDGAYTALGNYPDDEVARLVAALARRTDSDPGQVLQWFGRRAIPHLRRRYPDFFTPADPVSFVLTLQDVIHTEVEKLYPGAAPPDLGFSAVTATSVTIEYRSRRAMSDLAIGFLHGMADAYRHSVDIERADLDGDGSRVQLHCRFAAA